MTYMECPQCGRKALSVATRCPHCGVPFPSRPLRRSASSRGLDRLRPLLALVGVVVLAIAMVTLIVPRLRSKPDAGAPPPRDQTAMTSAPVAVPPDSLPESVPPASSPTISTAPAAVAPSMRGLRYARTWVNIRSARSRAAPSVRVLQPADSIQVDSLSRGWYRVLIDGRPAGYVHHSNLDSVPPQL
jgi:ribosomal protein L37E